jgi:hypothetical protein
LAKTSSVVVDDDGPLAMSLVAEFDLLATQVDRRFIATAFEAKRVIFLNCTSLLGVKQLVGILRRSKESNA